jgi:hypothetical protein
MTGARRAAGAACTAAVMAALAWTSSAPMTVNGPEHALLRLAWSARPERIETCREQSAEELARLPPHMRQPLACEGTTAQYRLQVRVDGTLLVDRTVHGGGLRRDRRLYVFEELPLRPGDVAVDVRFDRLGSGRARDAGEGTATPGTADEYARVGAPLEHGTAGRTADSVPAHSAISERLRLSPREVALVTYDPQLEQLAIRRSPRQPAHAGN